MQAYLPVKAKSKTLRCLVDPDIATAFAAYRLWMGSDGYVQAYQNHRQTYLHRCIVAARPGAHVDHKNGDRLDCRRANLRECSHSTNLHNMHTRSRARLGYYGVVPRKRQPVVYRVSLQLCNKTRACGAAWRSPVIASLVSDGFRRELLRSTVVTQNWPGTITPSRARVLLARPRAATATLHYSDPRTGRLRSVAVPPGALAGITACRRAIALEIGPCRYRVAGQRALSGVDPRAFVLTP